MNLIKSQNVNDLPFWEANGADFPDLIIFYLFALDHHAVRMCIYRPFQGNLMSLLQFYKVQILDNQKICYLK